MPQSLSKVYLHLVFSTKYRFPFISSDVETELYAYIGETINRHQGIPIMISGMPDHIHILTTLPRTLAIADFVREIKACSSHWIKQKGHSLHSFAWQNGYAVFSVSESVTPNVSAYIANQKKHHQRQTFEKEYLSFLKKYAVDYDERFVWD